MQTQPALRFIKPEVLSRISNLQLLARTVVEGFLSGLHKSPYKGSSVEFMSYRPYIHGDDPMHVDWKLYARTDRLYVKEYEDETNTSFNLLVDISPSMGFSSSAVSKLDYAFYLAASLGYFMWQQQEAVGLTLFDDKIVQRVPPRKASGHLLTILQQMHKAELGAPTNMGKPLHQLAELQKSRGFVVLISDLLDDPEEIINGIRHFRYAGNDVIVFHLFDMQEINFEYSDMIEFEDLETGEKMLLVAESAKDLYKKNLEEYKTRLYEQCAVLGADYHLVTTDQPLDHALFQFLAARNKRGK
ncbi:MAG: DUF58 domain-containing protein [Rhodothermales bacterium]